MACSELWHTWPDEIFKTAIQIVNPVFRTGTCPWDGGSLECWAYFSGFPSSPGSLSRNSLLLLALVAFMFFFLFCFVLFWLA